MFVICEKLYQVRERWVCLACNIFLIYATVYSNEKKIIINIFKEFKMSGHSKFANIKQENLKIMTGKNGMKL